MRWKLVFKIKATICTNKVINTCHLKLKQQSVVLFIVLLTPT